MRVHANYVSLKLVTKLHTRLAKYLSWTLSWNLKSVLKLGPHVRTICAKWWPVRFDKISLNEVQSETELFWIGLGNVRLGCRQSPNICCLKAPGDPCEQTQGVSSTIITTGWQFFFWSVLFLITPRGGVIVHCTYIVHCENTTWLDSPKFNLTLPSSCLRTQRKDKGVRVWSILGAWDQITLKNAIPNATPDQPLRNLV